MLNKIKIMRVGVVLTIVFALAFPYLGVKSYYLHIAILSLINIILALGLNIIAGYTGQLSLGHAAFFGIGSYTASILMLNMHISYWLAVPAGALVASLFGVLVGFPTLRLKGPYFVISTMAFGEIVRLTFLHWESVTRGPNGLIGIPGPGIVKLGALSISLEGKVGSYYLILAMVLIVLFFYNRLVSSRFGRALKAIRSDQTAAEVMGINLAFHKVLAFALTAFLAGLAGGLYAGYIRFISPDTFTVGESINILIMMVLGGMGTIVGPIVGAVGITFLLETMRVFAEYRMIVYGLMMFLIILYMPNGLAEIGGKVLNGVLQRFVSVKTNPVKDEKKPLTVEGQV